MALAYHISPSGDHVRIVGTGAITTDECIGMVGHILADPLRRPNTTALVDLRDASYVPEDNAEVVDIAKAVESLPFMRTTKVAIVATQSTIFPAELFCAHVREAIHLAIRVFVDLAAAESFCKGMSPTSSGSA